MRDQPITPRRAVAVLVFGWIAVALAVAGVLAATGCASRPERVEQPTPQPTPQPRDTDGGSTYTVPNETAVRPIGQPREWDQPQTQPADDDGGGGGGGVGGAGATVPAGPTPAPPVDEPQRDPFDGAPSWVSYAYRTQVDAIAAIERQAVVIHEFVRVAAALRVREVGWLAEAFDAQAEGMRLLRVLPPEYAEPFAEVLELLGRALAAERGRR